MATTPAVIGRRVCERRRVGRTRASAGAPICLEALHSGLERTNFARQLTDCPLEEFEAFAQRSVGIEGRTA